jgi:hypothetical protein
VNQLKSDMEQLQEEIKIHLVSSDYPLLIASMLISILVFVVISISISIVFMPIDVIRWNSSLSKLHVQMHSSSVMLLMNELSYWLLKLLVWKRR